MLREENILTQMGQLNGRALVWRGRGRLEVTVTSSPVRTSDWSVASTGASPATEGVERDSISTTAALGVSPVGQSSQLQALDHGAITEC